MAQPEADLPLDPVIAAALASLAPLEAQVVVLVYFGRRTQQQVADQLGIPLAAVAGAVSTGLQALTRFLDTHEIETAKLTA